MSRLRHLHWTSVARAAAIAIVLALTLTSATNSPYSPREKAFFADANTVQFVRPGLNLVINSATIAADRTITVVYTMTDPNGLPLDAAGITTPGAIALGYIATVLPNDKDQYLAYTTTLKSGVAVTGQNQPGVDAGGVTTTLAPGQYQYVFNTKAPAGYDATATHTIGMFASRVLTVYNLGTNFASATFNFVPNGAKVTKIHDVVKTASCNGCHDQLSWHGGRRRGLEMCVLCHTRQAVDVTNGNPLDLQFIVHEFHMGVNLPSVQAGKPAAVNGVDLSKNVYPDGGDPRRCETCHSQTSGATQAMNYLTKPTREACGACHNDVNFATGVNHPGGPQFDDNLCANCHIPQGEMDFDASIKGAHVTPTESSLLGGVVLAITKVSNGTAGSKPVVAYTIKDGAGKPLAPAKLGVLNFTLAGPAATDYVNTSFGTDVTTPGYVTESALTAGSCGADGSCLYTFVHAIPAKATGTYAIAIEALRTETVLAGTTAEQTITYGAKNQLVTFAVDGSKVTPRRAVVATASCNGCHVSLSAHEGLRNQIEYCTMCHNPGNTDAATRANATVASDKALPNEGLNFNLMVHRIHRGAQLPANRPYAIVGTAGSHNDYSGVLYAAMAPNGQNIDTRNCAMCHVGNSQLNLPAGNAVTDPQGPINPVQATTSACTGCHADIATASHALTNSNILGESCPICHATGTAYAVDQMHAQY